MENMCSNCTHFCVCKEWALWDGICPLYQLRILKGVIEMNDQIKQIVTDICPFMEDYGNCEDCKKEFDGEPCYYEKTAELILKYGYRKQSEGEWEIVKGSNGKEKMVCTNCRHQQDLASTFTYCPNCGARMGGGEE